MHHKFVFVHVQNGQENQRNCFSKKIHINPPTFGTFFIQVDAPFETIRYCGFEW